MQNEQYDSGMGNSGTGMMNNSSGGMMGNDQGGMMSSNNPGGGGMMGNSNSGGGMMGNSNSGGGMMGNNNSSGGGGDALDKGVDFLERKLGHEQSHSTTEKISDGLRTGFTKLTGKEVPIQDKQY